LHIADTIAPYALTLVMIVKMVVWALFLLKNVKNACSGFAIRSTELPIAHDVRNFHAKKWKCSITK
jgi:hypothetical protein